jgi:hypothetical protein
VGGTVQGLLGTGLVLQGDAAEAITIAPASGSPVSFAFPTKVPAGVPYSVVVKTQPGDPSQNCVVAGGTGMVTGDVSNIVVTCTTNKFTVGGTVTGVKGDGLVLKNNGGDSLAVKADGAFTFATPLASGAAYAVTVASSPTSPPQTCTATNASGNVKNGNVTDVQVTCKTASYHIGGTVSGLQGTGLVLDDNGTDDLTVAANGSFQFTQTVSSGGMYKVTVKQQPTNPSQNCTVSGDSGTVATGDVTSVVVNCAANMHTVGGTVTGLKGSGLTLTNSGGAPLAVTSTGFAFPPVATGTAYNVVVATQPSNPTQVCSVAAGAGTVGTTDVTNIVVTCTTSKFKIGGTISGLTGPIVLQDNGGDDLTQSADGPFTFATALDSGSSYTVTVKSQPPNQTCVPATTTGVVGNADVTNIAITCTTAYSVGGTVTGLAGYGFVLQDNGSDSLPVMLDGPFTFKQLLAAGASYQVSVATPPTGPGQTCTIANGQGTITGNVTNVAVTCATNYFINVTVTFNGPGGGVFSDGYDLTTISPPSTGNSVTYQFPSGVPAGSSYTVYTNAIDPNSTICDMIVPNPEKGFTAQPSISGVMPEGNVSVQARCVQRISECPCCGAGSGCGL